MKPLLAILSCEADALLEVGQRATFLKNSPIEHRFFRGRGQDLKHADVVNLNVQDDFNSLPFKTQAMLAWALANGYTHVFKCDTDTYVRPERLLTSGFERLDYAGYFVYDPCPGAYASGGSGYWISARAAALVTCATFISDYPNERTGDHSSRGEDLQVCWALRDHGISCVKDERYRLREPGPLRRNDYITLHDVIKPIKSLSRMAEVHQEFLNS